MTHTTRGGERPRHNDRAHRLHSASARRVTRSRPPRPRHRDLLKEDSERFAIARRQSTPLRSPSCGRRASPKKMLRRLPIESRKRARSASARRRTKSCCMRCGRRFAHQLAGVATTDTVDAVRSDLHEASRGASVGAGTLERPRGGQARTGLGGDSAVSAAHKCSAENRTGATNQQPKVEPACFKVAQFSSLLWTGSTG